MRIEDGRGSGRQAEVDSKYRIGVAGVTSKKLRDISDDGNSYSWSNVTYNYTALDTILLVKNTDTDKNLHIDVISFSSDASTEVIIHCPSDVATPAGTAVTGVNLNRSSSNTATAIAIGDETTNTQANVIWRGTIPADTVYVVDFDGAVVIPNGTSIAIDYTTVGTECNVTIIGHYE